MASLVLLLQLCLAKNTETRKWRDCGLAWLGWIKTGFLSMFLLVCCSQKTEFFLVEFVV